MKKKLRIIVKNSHSVVFVLRHRKGGNFLFDPSIMLGFKFQLLPRKEGISIGIILECIYDRTIAPWPVECQLLKLRTVHRGRYWLRNMGILCVTKRRTLKVTATLLKICYCLSEQRVCEVTLIWSEAKWSEAKWSEVKRSEVKWSEVKWSEVKWSEVKWSEVNYVEVLGDKSTMHVRVTLYWGYLIVLWLFYLVCILYCGCLNLFCNVWVCVCGGFVMCVSVLVICVLVFTELCIVCTVFLYCFVYVYLFLSVLSVLM